MDYYKILIVIQLFLVNVYVFYMLLIRPVATRRSRYFMTERMERDRYESKKLQGEIMNELNRLSHGLEKQDFRSFFNQVEKLEMLMKRTDITNLKDSIYMKELLFRFDEFEKRLAERINNVALQEGSRIENGFEQKIKYIASVTSDVAHTLRTPISGIKLTLNSMESKLGPEEGLVVRQHNRELFKVRFRYLGSN